jgi:nitrite reductase (NADH) large subunit
MARTAAWRCTVCGYVHQGESPPEWCPVCGAGRTDFEPYAEPAPAPAATPPARLWQCLNCNYVHAGDEPPEVCPVCGAPQDRFEAVAEEVGAPVRGAAAGHILVVGAGVAGLSAVESVRQTAPDARVTVVSKEPHLPYYRLNLTRYLAGEVDEDDLPIHPQAWYDEQNVDLVLGAEVAGLRLDAKTVDLRDGRDITFDRLVLTAGAHPFIPPISGAAKEGVTSLRTVEDARRILAYPLAETPCVVVGGGLLGLETAGALARRGARVMLLEGHGWLMPRQLSRLAGDLLREHLKGVGVDLKTEVHAKELVGDERVGGVLLDDGATVQAGLVVVATGVRPNSYLARLAGLTVNHGVVVDNRLTSSHPAVLAAGDVAEHAGILYGSWHASQFQGRIAGMNAAGAEAVFGGIPRSNTLKVLGVDVMSIGTFEPEDGSYSVLEDEGDGAYRRFVFHDGRMAGAILLGDASLSTAVKKAIEGETDFSALLAAGPTAADVADHLAAP